MGRLFEKLTEHSLCFFVRTKSTISEDILLTQCGSGVFIEINGKKAILTAGHVLEALLGFEECAIRLFKSTTPSQPIYFKSSEIFAAFLRPNQYGIDGPDIGVMEIPTSVSGTLNSQALYFNFDTRLQSIKSDSDYVELNQEFICGVPSAKIQIITRSDTLRTESVALDIAPGTTTKVLLDYDKFDRFEFRIHHNSIVSKPDSYAGMSGSAIWRTANSDKASDRLIAGIAFFETSPDDVNERTIICHGPKTIYKIVPELLKRATRPAHVIGPPFVL